MASAQINLDYILHDLFFDNFLISLLLTAPSYVDLSPGPFEDTQFDAVIDVETSDDCMDDEGITGTDISVKMAVRFTAKSVWTIVEIWKKYLEETLFLFLWLCQLFRSNHAYPKGGNQTPPYVPCKLFVYPFQIYHCYISLLWRWREWRCFVINPINIQYSIDGTVEWLLCSVDILDHWFKIKAMAD